MVYIAKQQEMVDFLVRLGLKNKGLPTNNAGSLVTVTRSDAVQFSAQITVELSSGNKELVNVSVVLTPRQQVPFYYTVYTFEVSWTDGQRRQNLRLYDGSKFLKECAMAYGNAVHLPFIRGDRWLIRSVDDLRHVFICYNNGARQHDALAIFKVD